MIEAMREAAQEEGAEEGEAEAEAEAEAPAVEEQPGEEEWEDEAAPAPEEWSEEAAEEEGVVEPPALAAEEEKPKQAPTKITLPASTVHKVKELGLPLLEVAVTLSAIDKESQQKILARFEEQGDKISNPVAWVTAGCQKIQCAQGRTAGLAVAKVRPVESRQQQKDCKVRPVESRQQQKDCKVRP